MSPPAVALLAALSWGSADFLGGVMSRRLSTTSVVLWSQAAPCAVLLTVAVAVGQLTVPASALIWAVFTGVCGAAGLLCFYRALAIGAMAIVAPVAACGAVIPVAVTLARGRSPGAIVLSGAVLALVGIVLVSRADPLPVSAGGVDRSSGNQARALALACLAAVGFGLFLLGAAQASGDARHAPIAVTLAIRLGSVGLQLLVIAARRQKVSIPPGWALVPIALVGLGDSLANLLYVLAARSGNLAVVSVLGSLYPLVPVALASLLLGERITSTQRVSVGLILVAVLLMAGGG